MTQSAPKEFAKLPVIEREERNLSLWDEPAQFASALDLGTATPDPNNNATLDHGHAGLDD